MGDSKADGSRRLMSDDDVNIEDDSDLIHDSLTDLETHAVELAKLAINFDNQNQWEPARYYYQVSSNYSIKQISFRSMIYPLINLNRNFLGMRCSPSTTHGEELNLDKSNEQNTRLPK